MRKPMTYVCLTVAVILTVLIVPVSARALMCYETTLDLQASVGPDSIDRVLYRWSDDEMIPGVQLMDWSMELQDAGSAIYIDTIKIGGVVKPLGGVARTAPDLIWAFNLGTLTLEQMRNVIFSFPFASTTGTLYHVRDSLTLPADSMVKISKYIGGIHNSSFTGLLASQATAAVNCPAGPPVEEPIVESIGTVPTPMALVLVDGSLVEVEADTVPLESVLSGTPDAPGGSLSLESGAEVLSNAQYEAAAAPGEDVAPGEASICVNGNVDGDPIDVCTVRKSDWETMVNANGLVTTDGSGMPFIRHACQKGIEAYGLPDTIGMFLNLEDTCVNNAIDNGGRQRFSGAEIAYITMDDGCGEIRLGAQGHIDTTALFAEVLTGPFAPLADFIPLPQSQVSEAVRVEYNGQTHILIGFEATPTGVSLGSNGEKSGNYELVVIPDEDEDTVPDDVDQCPGFDDRDDEDEDTVPDECDNCPSDENTDQADTDEDGPGDVCDACPNDPDNDSDNDTICGDIDACMDTVIPENVPTSRLGTNRFALVDGDGIFDTTSPKGKGPGKSFTIEDTAGCSCEQIINELGLGKGHSKFGCSIGAIEEWINGLSWNYKE